MGQYICISTPRIVLFGVLLIVCVWFPTESFIVKENNDKYYKIMLYDENDESYLQRDYLYLLFVNVINSVSIVRPAPIWGSEERKYLTQVKYRCFMYNGQAPIKTNRQNSHLATEEFVFTSKDVRENPSGLRAVFNGRKHQRFAFLIHGWVTAHMRYDIHLRPFLKVIATDLRSKLQMNVIIVDYYELGQWDYSVASKGNTLYIAKAVESLIHTMAASMDMTAYEKEQFLMRMMMMGHSLGCHIAGLAAHLVNNRMAKQTNALSFQNFGGYQRPKKSVGTIFGVDCAGPLFPPYTTTRHCLTHKDANRVIMLHTGGMGLGNSYRVGHEDYYANGGEMLIPPSATLSHMRAGNLFRELIWTTATGYMSKKPKRNLRKRDIDNSTLVQRIEFDLSVIPNGESKLISHPIYLPVNIKYPYFDRRKPRKIPAYSFVRKRGWEKILFKDSA